MKYIPIIPFGLALLIASCTTTITPVATSMVNHRTPMPTPDSATVTITGRFIQTHTNLPLKGQSLYLADLLPVTPGPGYLITLDQKKNLHATIDSEGYFGLAQVPPGTYALVVWTPVASRVVHDPNKPEREFLITVSEGQALDLGEISIDWQ